MAAMALRDRAVARVRAARRPGTVRRLRRADADDGGRVGAARPDGAGDRHGADGAAARARRSVRSSAASSRGSSACGARSSSRRSSTSSRSCSCSVMYDERARARTSRRRRSRRTRDVPQRARVRELHPADGGHLRPAVRRPQLRAGPAAVRRGSSARRLRRVPLVAGLLFSIAAGAGALGHHLCGSCCAVRPRGRSSARAPRSAPWALWLYVVASGTVAALRRDADLRPRDRRRDDRRLHGGGSGDSGPARGAGFGLLTTASLVGLALSPIVSGFLGATSIRAVFVLDAVALVALAGVVTRLMIRRARDRQSRPRRRRTFRLGIHLSRVNSSEAISCQLSAHGPHSES